MTPQQKIAAALVIAQEIETKYNELIDLCITTPQPDSDVQCSINAFTGNGRFLEFKQEPFENGHITRVRVIPESFIDYGYAHGNGNLTDYLK